MPFKPIRCHPVLFRALGMLALCAAVGSAQSRRAPAPVRHVFVIVLENHGFDTTFSEGSRAPYLADSLVQRGAFLRQYHGIGHVSLDNYIAMISGLAPTHQTQLDCPRFVEFERTGTTRDGQPIGTGCVYPATVKTLGNQLESKRLTWRAFMEDMGADTTRERRTCAHPVIGGIDSTQRATPLDQYATKHNPFMYFHAVIDSPSCDKNVVPLSALGDALKSVATTPNFSFISPDLCHDGHDRPCKNGEPGGLESADEFLARWIPRITSSPAFRADGMLVITFDEALTIDASSCCNEQPGPNVTNAGINGPGGGRVGAVVLSPFIRPGTISDTPYNHYALLRTIEDIFGLDHLGYAGQRGVNAFGRDVFASAAQAPGFGVCKPVAERRTELGCWVLADQSVGNITAPEVYWHLESYRDSAQAQGAKGPRGVVIRALNKTWLMTIDSAGWRPSHPGTHVADIGPLHVTPGTEYSATFMEAITTPGTTSAVHRHAGPEAWYVVSGETCLETPSGKVVATPGHPAIVPEGPPMFLTAIGKQQRRGITLILHDAKQPPAIMEHAWKPTGLCK